MRTLRREDKMREYFKGKKTYLIAFALVVYAISGVVAGQINPNEAILVVLNGLGLGAVRAGVEKSGARN